MSTNPLELLLLAGAAATRFPPNSRYHGIETATTVLPDGRTVVHLRRRFAPQPAALTLLHEVRVSHGDRLDNLAAQHLGDPELFWRICDANSALRPGELTETIGRTLRIALADGTAGGAHG